MSENGIFVSEKARQDFTELLNSFSQSLYLLNINLYLLRKIFAFPFRLCGQKSEDRLFFFIAEKNFFEYSIIVARRMLFDPNGWTLEKFRNEYGQYLTDEYRKKLAINVRALKKGRLRELEKRVNTYRNEWLAHSDMKFINQSDTLYRLSFDDLCYLIESINSYFDFLSDLIDTDYSKLPFSYEKDNGNVTMHVDFRNDIEQILDNIAIQSPLLKLKEEDPEEWGYYINKWKRMGQVEENLKFINYYRRELGLPEVNAN